MNQFTYGAYPGINMKKRIIDKEIVKDISRGMTGSELSKYPRAEHVAFRLPPRGGLSACPQRRQAELLPHPEIQSYFNGSCSW